ncbi:MAG: hypothetical protein VXY91_07500 [Bacteroidota bacterium]|nr:hypothetical protein [Bacteroidota bacterium]
MTKQVRQFYQCLFIVAVIGWQFQSYIMQLPMDGLLGTSYLLNYMTAAGIFATLLKLKNKHEDKLGLVSLVGTLIKFVLFFLVFDPLFQADGDTTRAEFAVFFIPYVCATIIETAFLVRILNRQIN